MKNLIFLFALILLFSISCKDSTSKVEQKLEEASYTETDSVETENCMNLDSQIYRETALMWEKSWLKENPSHDVETSPTISFSSDSLSKLRKLNTAKYSTDAGVRMYYILLPDAVGDIPALALVNMDACLTQNDCAVKECVLISDFNGNESFVSQVEFEGYKDGWVTYSKTKADLIPAYTAVYAYNYPWVNIENAGIKDGDGIWVKYGLRSLGPLDSNLYIEDYDEKLTGSIVYCNVIYEGNPMQLEQQYFDFAKPCPRFCDDN